VDDRDEWADHWSCRLDYKAVNQSITFQNWHSSGRGGIPKGLPMRVTGGNSAPDPQQGSPRLNTVWYNNFYTGDDANHDSDFKAPNFGVFCIPVGLHETREFFGHEVNVEHTFSAGFHQRAHYLPHARPSSLDLRRAKQAKPGRAFARDTFEESMQALNAVLSKVSGLQAKKCSEFSLPELHATQLALFNARAPALDAVYRNVSDTRLMAHATASSLQARHSMRASLTLSRPELAAKIHDGACHEAVMWYVHHLTETARNEIHSHIVLPLLPEHQHAQSDVISDTEAATTNAEYKQQVSCAICHVSVSNLVV